MSSPLHLLETGCGIARESSSFESGRRAAVQAVSTITTLPLSVVMVFATVGDDLNEALRGVRSITGAAPLIGAATGEICPGSREGGISVAVLASPHLRVRYAVGAQVDGEWRDAVARIMEEPELAPYFSRDGELLREPTVEGKSLFGIIFAPGVPGTALSPHPHIPELLAQRSLGRIPFFGVSAPRDKGMTRPSTLANDGAVTDGLLVALFESRLRFGIALPAEIPGMCALLDGVPLEGFRCLGKEGRGEGLSGQDNGAIRTLILGRELFPGDRKALENDRLQREPQGAALLESSEQFVRSTLDTFPSVICLVDENGVIMATNNAWRDFALANALSPEVGEGSNYLEICDRAQGVSGDGAAEFAQGIRQVIHGEISGFSREYSCDSPVQRRWFVGTVVKLQGVTPTRVMITHENITHLKLTEESLRESLDNYRLFFETMDDLIFIGGADGSILYANPAVSRKLGYPGEKLLTMGLLDLHPDSCRGEAAEILAEMLKGERDSCPLPLLKQDGGLLPVETRIWRGEWNGRKVLFGLSKDLSTLKTALEMFREIFEHNPSPLTLSRVDTGVFVKVNAAFRQTLGYDSRELLGRTSGELGLFTDGAAEQRALRRVLKTGRLDGFQLSIRTKSGELRTGIFSGVTIDNQGERLFLTVMSDITENKRFQEELLRSRTLAEAANLAKSAFLATMSHELRTPLNSILGMCEVLGEQACGVIPDEQRRHVAVIDESGRHLLALINDILDLSRIEADKLELELSFLTLEDLCRSSLTFVGETAFKKRIGLAMTMNRTPDRFRSDSRRLKQILINLLSNAVKFTPEGGAVALEVEGDPQRRELRFTVGDTGIGIASDDLKKLFHPFVQVDSSLARRYEGTGLGLVLVARLSELLGGAVAVESEPGKGSRFTIILPWPDSETEPARETPELLVEPLPPAAPFPGFFLTPPLILLAEDNRASREAISTYLRMKGYRVITGETGAQAVTLAGEERPDLILMDVQMPVLDGLTAIREIRAFPPPGSAVPIIVLTALAMPGDKERCLEAGADAYLDKPLSLRKLSEQIAEMLEDEGSRFKV